MWFFMPSLLTIQAFNKWLEKKNPSSKQKKEKFKELISGIFGVRPLIIHKSTCLLVQSPYADSLFIIMCACSNEQH